MEPLTVISSTGHKATLIDCYVDAEIQHVFFLQNDLSLVVSSFHLDADPAEVVDLASAYAITEGIDYFVEVSDLTDASEVELRSIKLWLMKNDALTESNQRLFDDAEEARANRNDSLSM